MIDLLSRIISLIPAVPTQKLRLLYKKSVAEEHEDGWSWTLQKDECT